MCIMINKVYNHTNTYMPKFLYVWLVREKLKIVREKSGNFDILCEWQPWLSRCQVKDMSEWLQLWSTQFHILIYLYMLW